MRATEPAWRSSSRSARLVPPILAVWLVCAPPAARAADKDDARARWGAIEELEVTFQVSNNDTRVHGGGDDVRRTAHREASGSCLLQRSNDRSAFGPRWTGKGSGAAQIDVEVRYPKMPSLDAADRGGGPAKVVCSFSTDFTGPGSYFLGVSLSGGSCEHTRPGSKSSGSCDLAGLHFESKGSLPAGTTLSGSGMPGTATRDAHYTFTISPAGARSPPRADPGGPYTVLRGETVKLDGSGSQGRNLTYRWTFSGSCEDGPPPSTTTVLTSAQAFFIALCDLDATLEVADGDRKDKKTTRVTVTPRPWKLEVKRDPAEGLFLGTPPFRSSVSLATIGGAERCALDLAPGSAPVPFASLLAAQHVFHPHLPNGESWRGHAYELDKVTDGPFAGRWYLSRKLDDLQVVRRRWMNAYNLPGGPPAGRASEDVYSANKRLHRAIDAYIAAARAHEDEHSRLLGVALHACDPLTKIERMVGEADEDLASRADAAIRTADKTIDDFSDDPLPLTWEGSLAFPADDTGSYVDRAGKATLSTVDVGVKGTPTRSPPSCD